MQHGVGVSGNPIADCAGTPGFRRRVDGHVNHQRRANDIAARNASFKTAVQRIAAVVAHHEVAVRRNGVRKNMSLAHKRRAVHRWIGRIGAPNRVVFAQSRPVDPDSAVAHVHRFAGKSDHALDDVRIVAGNHRPENYNLAALGISPQRNVPVGEGNAGVVAHTAHDQMVANQQSVLHGLGGNHSRLTDRTVDQQENQGDPEPGERLAADFLLHGQLRLFRFVALRCLLSLHVPPPLRPVRPACRLSRPRAPRVAPGRWDNFPYSTTYKSCPECRSPLASIRSWKYSRANPRRENDKFLPENSTTQSVLPWWECPHRSSIAKLSADRKSARELLLRRLRAPCAQSCGWWFRARWNRPPGSRACLPSTGAPDSISASRRNCGWLATAQ